MFSPNIIKFCEAIKEREGWFTPVQKHPNGSRSYRNHSPGNFRYSDYAKSLGAIGKDVNGYAIFPNCDVGFNAVCQLVMDAAKNELKSYKNCTILSFFAVYAPSSDKNDPVKYAQFVAEKVGVDPHTSLVNLL